MRTLFSITFFFLVLSVVKAAPSGVLGLGDSGGSNRDESKNFNQVTNGDSFMDGQRNTFSPSADLGGISGVGLSLS